MTGRSYDNTFICQEYFEETCYITNTKRSKPCVVPRKYPPMKDEGFEYVLTIKFSSDSIEMFIGEMRQMIAAIFKVMRTLCCRVITIF